jgi:hypothetical protein
MSRVSHFQRFSQPENHATNNTLLAFRFFYQSSPFKLQRVLTSLLESDLSIGLTFEQQIKGQGRFIATFRRSKPQVLVRVKFCLE